MMYNREAKEAGGGGSKRAEGYGPNDFHTSNYPKLKSGLKMWIHAIFQITLKNSLIIQEENTKKNHKRVVSLYVIKNHVNLHKL